MIFYDQRAHEAPRNFVHGFVDSFGKCYQTYLLEDGDELDIISTNKSVYGYLSISGKFDLKYYLQHLF